MNSLNLCQTTIRRVLNVCCARKTVQNNIKRGIVKRENFNEEVKNLASISGKDEFTNDTYFNWYNNQAKYIEKTSFADWLFTTNSAGPFRGYE